MLCACDCDLPQLQPTGQPRLHKCLHPDAECGHRQPQSRWPHVLGRDFQPTWSKELDAFHKIFISLRLKNGLLWGP